MLASPLPADAQSLEPLAERLRSRETEERRDAVLELKAIGNEKASRTALPALKDSDAIVRAVAAGAMVHLPAPEAAAVLSPILGDGSELVRKEAAAALGRTGSDGAEPLSARLSKEKDLEVRAAIAMALGETGSQSAVDALIGLLTVPPKEDQEFIRRSAARALGRIAEFERTGRFDTVTPHDFLPDPEAGGRGARAAGKSAVSDRVRPLLVRMLADKAESDDVRREAVYALGALGDPSVRPLLEPLVLSEDPYLAAIAKEALARLPPAPEKR